MPDQLNLDVLVRLSTARTKLKPIAQLATHFFDGGLARRGGCFDNAQISDVPNEPAAVPACEHTMKSHNLTSIGQTLSPSPA